MRTVWSRPLLTHLQQVFVQDVLAAAGAHVLACGRHRAGGGGGRAHGRGGRAAAAAAGGGRRAGVLALHVGPLRLSVRVRLQEGGREAGRQGSDTRNTIHTASSRRHFTRGWI